MKIAFIRAGWHSDLVEHASKSCADTLKEAHPRDLCIEEFEVPGSLEIPLFALKTIQRRQVDAVIGFGLVVDGGIYRHEFVAQSVLDGMMRVQLDTGVPVFSCVLTPQVFQETDAEHQRF